MKTYLMAAAAVALLSTPAFAVSVISAGTTVAQECSNAAGQTNLTERQMNSAMAACNAALAGDLSIQARAGTLVNRGLVQASAGNSAAAMADFDAAVARDPSLAAAYLQRGTALMRAHRFSEARADFNQAISLKVADAHIAYFNRGGANEELGNKVAAYRDYRAAQELAPGFKPASAELARFQVTDRRVASN